MADKIKKFWEKKKTEAKFKMAGPGHKLNETKSPGRQKQSASSGYSLVSRSAPSDEAKQAAAAAMARFGGSKQDAPGFNTSMAAIRAQVKRELEAEKAAEVADVKNSSTSADPNLMKSDNQLPLALAVQGVYFKCPLISEEILPKEEWRSKIREFLYGQLDEEPGLTACLIIHSCNKNREKVEQCVETLCKYLENIIQNPGEEKYHKIRMSNRVFLDKVSGMEGAMEFLDAAGFKIEIMPFQDNEDKFLVFSEEKLEEIEGITMLVDALRTAEPIGLLLDRNLQVLSPSQAATRKNLPPDFFKLTPEELKREQQLKTEKVENNLMLRTKAMREREEQREMKKYRFALIRIRFPDGLLIQGTFGIYEHLSEVIEFVKENLIDSETNFILQTATGHKLTEEDNELPLIELKLVPATVLTFVMTDDHSKPQHWDSTVILKPDILLLIQQI